MTVRNPVGGGHDETYVLMESGFMDDIEDGSELETPRFELIYLHKCETVVFFSGKGGEL